MKEKKFVGLDGLKYFWTKIEAKVIKIIEDEIAQIIAEAPENLNTLREIADWISTHEDSASAMNTAILANKTAISGKADKSHTHTKSQITDFPTSLPANGGTATKATQDGNGNVITSTYVKKSGDTLTSSTSDTPLYVNTTASGKTKSWIGFQIGSVSKNYIGADQNGLYSYTNSKNNKILDTSAQTLTDEEKTQVRSNIGAGTSSLTIGTTETTAAAGNHTHSGYLTAHQDISGKLNVDGSNATNTGTSAIVHSLDTATGDVTDDTEIITSNASGYSSSDTKYYKRAGNKLWNYIKGKISSVLGLTATNYGGKATKATQDGSGNVITSTYVKKSGDTLTGPIVMKANQYTLDTAQLDMKNSDIKGANAIWFDDHAEVGEGLKFPRSSGSNYDFMRLDDGKIKVAPNVTGNANTATESIVAYTSDIPTSLPANGGTATTATNLKVSNHDANNTTYYPIWANGKGDGTTARGTYTSTNLNYIPATGNFKSKQFTVGGGVSLIWNSATKSLDFTFA